MVRIKNHGSWKTLAEHLHTKQRIDANEVCARACARVRVSVCVRAVQEGVSCMFSLCAVLIDGAHRCPQVAMYVEHAQQNTQRTRYEVLAEGEAVPELKPELVANPKMGVGLVAWSPNSQYLATRNDNMPRVLWVWDMQTLALKTVLIHVDPVRCGPPQHGLSSNKMALITSGCGKTRSPSTKWP